MKTSRNKPKRKIPFAKYMQRKLAFVFFTVALALFALGFVLVGIAKEDGEDYKRIVLSQQSYDSRVIMASRGEIWDRNGTRLAMNEKVYNLILDPKVMLSGEEKNYRDATLDALVSVFGYDRAELEGILEEKPESSYVRYARQLSGEQKEAFLAYQEEFNDRMKKEKSKARVKGVWFEDEYKRIYPYNNLACELIGFSSGDGTQGNWGMEQYYNDELAGTNGREYGYLNDDSNLERVTVKPQNGYTLVSTIDATAQQIVEEHIVNFNATIGAKNVACIVMKPDTAEVLAMAASDSFNLNQPADLTPYFPEDQIAAMTQEEKTDFLNNLWRNFCISDTYEPGSTAKSLTIAAGIEEARLKGNESFLCDGYEEVGGYKIGCHNTRGHGWLTVTQALMSSCNDALMQMARDYIKPDVFCRYQKIFGLGQTTGIDLPGEAEGLLHDEESMGSTDLATNSFGQNFNVTMIQMAAAYCSLLNGGYYYEPRMVKQILDEDGNVVKNLDPVLVRRTISEHTSEFIKEALFQVVEGGTGQKAAIPGYEMGGKTGTGEKYPRGNEKYIISFVACIPAHNPELFIYTLIDEPNIPKQSESKYVTDLCRDILVDLLPYFNIYPTREVPTEEQPPEETQPEDNNPGNPDGENPDGENPDGENPEEPETNPITIIDSEENYDNSVFYDEVSGNQAPDNNGGDSGSGQP